MEERVETYRRHSRFKDVKELRWFAADCARRNPLARDQFVPSDAWFEARGLVTREQKEEVSWDDVNWEWNRQWDLMMQDGQYEYTVGDFILPALSDSLGLDIMIFNTNQRTGGGPLTLSQADVWGGPAATEPPLLVAYDGSHYESLLPVSRDDELMTINLVQRMKDGAIVLRYEDLKEVFPAKAPRGFTQGMSWATVAKHGGKRNRRQGLTLGDIIEKGSRKNEELKEKKEREKREKSDKMERERLGREEEMMREESVARKEKERLEREKKVMMDRRKEMEDRAREVEREGVGRDKGGSSSRAGSLTPRDNHSVPTVSSDGGRAPTTGKEEGGSRAVRENHSGFPSVSNVCSEPPRKKRKESG